MERIRVVLLADVCKRLCYSCPAPPACSTQDKDDHHGITYDGAVDDAVPTNCPNVACVGGRQYTRNSAEHASAL